MFYCAFAHFSPGLEDGLSLGRLGGLVALFGLLRPHNQFSRTAVQIPTIELVRSNCLVCLCRGVVGMWRAFFMAVGINLLIIGAQFLVVEKVIISKPSDRVAKQQELTGANYYNASYGTQLSGTAQKRKTFKPKDWMPWGLLAAGTIIVIYTRNYKSSS